MGATIWIKAEDAPEAPLPNDLSTICKNMNLLDKACRQAGVKEWSDLQDNSEMVAAFGDEIPPLWTNPADLIMAIEACQKAIDDGRIRADESILTRLSEELEDATEVVQECYGAGKRVRVMLVP